MLKGDYYIREGGSLLPCCEEIKDEEVYPWDFFLICSKNYELLFRAFYLIYVEAVLRSLPV